MAFRWAILGAGRIAGKFADAVKRVPGCEMAAVASRSQERAEAFAQAQGIPAAFGDYAQMLQEVRPDAVYIAVTTNAHAALTRLCIEHQVPVLCEKAMFTSFAEAEETFALARERGVFVMEAMWARFLPAVQEMKRQLDAGVIGQPRFAELAVGWHAPTHPGNRFFDPAQGGGAAYDLLVYAYELADFFLGEEISTGEPRVLWTNTGVDGTESVTLRYADCLADLSASIETNLEERCVICGTQGRLHMPKPHMSTGFVRIMNDGTETHWQDTQTINGFVYEVEEVVRCVQQGLQESPVVPHALTMRCARLFDRIMQTKDDAHA